MFGTHLGRAAALRPHRQRGPPLPAPTPTSSSSCSSMAPWSPSARAAVALESKDVPTKSNSISKAIEIIVNGLAVSLDMEAGGELSERLAALYDYMARASAARQPAQQPPGARQVAQAALTARRPGRRSTARQPALPEGEPMNNTCNSSEAMANLASATMVEAARANDWP